MQAKRHGLTKVIFLCVSFFSSQGNEYKQYWRYLSVNTMRNKNSNIYHLSLLWVRHNLKYLNTQTE